MCNKGQAHIRLSAVKLFAAFQTVANWFKCDVHFLRRKVLFMSALACKLKSVFAVGKCDLYWGRKEEEEEERGQRGGTHPQDELIWESLGTHAP